MMLEQEILEIVRGPPDGGERLNRLADQFRNGRKVSDLLALLDSSDAELASLGAWILGELQLELYNFDQVISRLHKLIDHQDPAVRFHALGALFPALNPQDVATTALLMKLRNDPNEGVRRNAEAAASRLSLT